MQLLWHYLYTPDHDPHHDSRYDDLYTSNYNDQAFTYNNADHDSHTGYDTCVSDYRPASRHGHEHEPRPPDRHLGSFASFEQHVASRIEYVDIKHEDELGAFHVKYIFEHVSVTLAVVCPELTTAIAIGLQRPLWGLQVPRP
jgi:hypothetical protein